MPVSNEPPPPRAYHTITRIGSRFLLIGGYDGKSTFSDMWWLVSEGPFHFSQVPLVFLRGTLKAAVRTVYSETK